MEYKNLYGDAMVKLEWDVPDREKRKGFAAAYARRYHLSQDPPHPLTWFAHYCNVVTPERARAILSRRGPDW